MFLARYFEYLLCYISILHQTTTSPRLSLPTSLLCYISILHQTTTARKTFRSHPPLCYISILHQTTTRRPKRLRNFRLCYISILHQTTTASFYRSFSPKLCYISILHQTTTFLLGSVCRSCCVIFLFYIKPQPLPSPAQTIPSCVIFLFYIKPQPSSLGNLEFLGCVIFLFYIKPQRVAHPLAVAPCCVIFLFYIKPQQGSRRVVSCQVVLYFYSTSNHNCYLLFERREKLCYISILHQTTTSGGLSVDNALFMRQIGCPKMCLRDPKKRK